MPAELIGAIVLLLTTIAAYIKAHTEVAAVKNDRLATKAARDADSLELHDKVQKAVWDIGNLKSNAAHRDTLIEDLQKQINILNSTLAVTNTKLDTLVGAIRDLKK